MGSYTDGSPELLPASSDKLILTQPTPAERERTWSLTHPQWGPALSHDGYLRREAYLTTVPLAKDGGMTHWILTDGTAPPDHRPILSSCETLRKPAVACHLEGDGPATRDGCAFGIASVFTEAKYRGNGYASRMMKELGPALREWRGDAKGRRRSSGHGAAGKGAGDADDILFSVLFSDIGKKFYAAHGWAPFESSHLAFPPAEQGSVEEGSAKSGAAPVGYHELAELCNVDERLVRETLNKRAAGSTAGGQQKTFVSLLPNLDTILWHMMREDFMTNHIFGKTPSIKGAVYGQPGKRVWAIWSRGYYGNLTEVKGNTFYILRFVVEDEGASMEYLVEAFKAIMELARQEALKWNTAEVQMWNPTPLTQQIVEQSGLKHELVARDADSIGSLMWYGEGSNEDVDWVFNEKFGWC